MEIKKEKLYKIVREYSSYSKKKGSIQKKMVIEKGLTLESAVSFANKIYPETISIK